MADLPLLPSWFGFLRATLPEEQRTVPGENTGEHMADNAINYQLLFSIACINVALLCAISSIYFNGWCLEGHPLLASVCLFACKNKDFAAAIHQHLVRAVNSTPFLFSVLIKSLCPEDYLIFA
jgi:hypothetical protein